MPVFCADARCSRHAGSVAAHCSKLQCSRRPDRHVGHPLALIHAAQAVTNTVLAHIPKTSIRPSVRGCFCERKRSKNHTGAGGHAIYPIEQKSKVLTLYQSGRPTNELTQRLQQLRRHRHRNHLRQLTIDPRNTNRRRDTRKVLRTKTPLL
jgi:hypothetical protein